jgi:cobyrinic acid a,c-diamide synthase
MVKSLVIAGTQSGVGKTTLVVGLIAALRARGLTVQPFKVGPDYIDSSHHSLAACRPCRNLDTWMMSPERTKALFEHAARSADVALIEGVMGLFDGFGYEDESGSTAQVAKLLHTPVLLVIDASKVARSAAAFAVGFQRFDPQVRVAGFLVNRVGSESHGRGVASAIAQATGLPVLGWLPRAESLSIPERHLGLIPSAEPGRWAEFGQATARALAKYVDLDGVLALAGDCHLPGVQAQAQRSRHAPRDEFLTRSVTSTLTPDDRVVIAVARDEAFHFCYQENLTLMEEAGATLQFFSPLHDEALPVGTAGVLLSGGFPEVYAGTLSANARMHASLRDAHAQGLPIYAECGGLMYLTESITDFDGRCMPMAGLLPGRSVMTRRLTLGYRQAQASSASWLFHEKESVRGHEFHYSTWEDRPTDLPAAYLLTPRDGAGTPRLEGACVGNLFASYVHLHFWGKPELAQRFVAQARRVSKGSSSLAHFAG